MWVYVLSGLLNFWMILIKVILFLFLLGVEDVVYWVCEFGGLKIVIFDYLYGDWWFGYFMVFLVFYFLLIWVSEKVFGCLIVWVSCGQVIVGGMI